MTKRNLVAAFMVGFAFLAVTALSSAQSDTNARVAIESESVALGVGVTWGEGKLTYRGKVYPFTVKGLSVADLGISRVSATGEVSDLKRVEDFEGQYAASGAGAAVGAGGEAAAMVNQKGVKMAITGLGQGVRFTLAPSGIEIKLKK